MNSLQTETWKGVKSPYLDNKDMHNGTLRSEQANLKVVSQLLAYPVIIS